MSKPSIEEQRDRLRISDARRRALKSLKGMSHEEDAAITADAQADPDNPPADELIRRKGRPPLANPKVQINIRLDADVVDHFRAEGAGWQSRINAALRTVLQKSKV